MQTKSLFLCASVLDDPLIFPCEHCENPMIVANTFVSLEHTDSSSFEMALLAESSKAPCPHCGIPSEVPQMFLSEDDAYKTALRISMRVRSNPATFVEFRFIEINFLGDITDDDIILLEDQDIT